jgi:hypothetical protein
MFKSASKSNCLVAGRADDAGFKLFLALYALLVGFWDYNE